jgi:MFS family permease
MTFSLSQAISFFGDKLDYMALLAMVSYFSVRFGWVSAQSLSLFSAVAAMPTVIFGPLAGVLVDRWNRKKVMIICDAARFLLVAAIPTAALATSSMTPVCVLAFAVFSFGLFFNSARLSVIPNLVGPDLVLGANSFINFIGRIATFLGMFLGALIVDWALWERIGIRPRWRAGFYLDSLTYAISLVALVVIYRRLDLRRRPEETATARPTSRLPLTAYRLPQTGVCSFQFPISNFQFPILTVAWGRLVWLVSELREAGQVVAEKPSVLFSYLSVIALALVGSGLLVLYVPLIQGARNISGLGLGTRGVGYIAAVGAVGLLISSVLYGAIGHRLRKHKVMLVCFLILGLQIIGLAWAKTLVLVPFLVFLAGFAISPIFIGMDTLLHEAVPEAARGRIFSTREWLLYLTFAITSLLTGQLTRLFPSREILLGIGLLVTAASVAGLGLTRRSRIG